jgi:protein TonB
MESTILPATVISILFHCLIAALLFFCLKESRLLTLPQTIISVDIRTLEPEKEEKTEVVPPAPEKPVSKLTSRPLPRPAPAQAAPAETPPLAMPLQGRSESTAKSISLPIPALNPFRAENTTLPGNGTTSPIAGPVDVNRQQAYLGALKEIIERNKEYPLMARKGGMEGTVRIRCALLRNGELRDASVIKPSGYTILDNAALRAVRSAGRYPALPSEIKGETFSFVAPITFRLAPD